MPTPTISHGTKADRVLGAPIRPHASGLVAGRVRHRVRASKKSARLSLALRRGELGVKNHNSDAGPPRYGQQRAEEVLGCKMSGWLTPKLVRTRKLRGFPCAAHRRGRRSTPKNGLCAMSAQPWGASVVNSHGGEVRSARGGATHRRKVTGRDPRHRENSGG